MKNRPSLDDLAVPEQRPRPNLNKAASQVAAAFGLKLGYRENQAPASERMSYRWTCRDETTGQSWDMELVCLPVLWGQEGWIGSVRISRYGTSDILDQWFVSYGDRLYGRKAARLTRERFCACAALLEPGSRLAWKADAGKPKTPENRPLPSKPIRELFDAWTASRLNLNTAAAKPETLEGI